MNAEVKRWVTVAQIETVDHKSIRAVASIRLGALTVHGVRVIENSDGSLWVALPKEKRGEDYVPIVEVKSRELMQAIRDAVLDAYKIETSPQHTVTLLGVGEQTPHRVGARKPRGTAQKEKRPVFGDILLEDEDISDVGL